MVDHRQQFTSRQRPRERLLTGARLIPVFLGIGPNIFRNQVHYGMVFRHCVTAKLGPDRELVGC